MSTQTTGLRSGWPARSSSTWPPSSEDSPRGATSVTPPSATRPNAVSEWCDTPRCRGRGSASEIRSAPIASPPSTVTALHASPAATPEKPHGVPVPRLPGPCVTIARSALQHVPGRQQAGVHGDRLQVAAERLARR